MIRTLTAEQFIEQRFDMPDSGQWAELVEGVPVFLEPPDLDHGNAILNLSKAVAAYVQQGVPGYACFDLGLLMGRAPDTIRFPAMCWFATGERFEESDKDITETVPTLVVDHGVDPRPPTPRCPGGSATSSNGASPQSGSSTVARKRSRSSNRWTPPGGSAATNSCPASRFWKGSACRSRTCLSNRPGGRDSRQGSPRLTV